jgi:formylglycine-generating enzyme required for sulfatase activity/tRNA A-37 threonylcarbamoyl transferase component Bud32
VNELVRQWQELREQGRAVSAEELCAACPDLLDELRRHIEALVSMERFLGATGSGATVTGAEAASQVETRPGLPGDGTGVPAEGAPQVGSRYRPLRLHAKGGLGEVYLAQDEELSREVALKRMRRPHAGDHDSRRRFLREGEITGSLEHPGVVPVYGLTRDADGQPCYAMRFIRGQTLQEAIARFHATTKPDRHLALRQLLSRFVAVCNTMAYAHSRGVIHRDLKPANIMLGGFGETLVVDWGLAKRVDGSGEGEIRDEDRITTSRPDQDEGATATGDVLGTPAFMSPEQASGRPDLVGPASDIYSLGATLYAVLTGRPPFTGQNMGEVFHNLQRGVLSPPRQVRPDTPRALDAICLKAMAHTPAARYTTALDLAADLERWLADEPVTAYREPLLVRQARWRRRHKTKVAAFVVLVITALVVGGLAAVVAGREQAKAQAHGRVEALRDAATAAVPVVLADLDPSQPYVLPRLQQLWEQEDLPENQRRRIGLALLPAHSGPVRQRLMEMMLKAEEPEEMLLLRDGLAPSAAEWRADLWLQARQETTDSRTFRLLVVLAAFDPDSENWPAVADRLVELLLTSNSLQRGLWTTALAPIRRTLIGPLSKAARQVRTTERGLLAATILAEYAGDQPAVLIESLLEASPEQFAVLWPKLRAHHAPLLTAMDEELRRIAPPGASDAVKDQLASRQASAAVTLAKLGKAGAAWPLLRSSPEPRLRSYMIHRFGPMQVEPDLLLGQLSGEEDTSVRQALLLSLGEYAAGNRALPGPPRQLRAKLLTIYRDDPDPGVHSAVDWLLRRLGASEEVLAADKELATIASMPGRRWYVNPQGHTMVIVPGGAVFPMRVFSKAAEEVLKPRRLPYSFAVATKQTTLGQFRRFLRAHPNIGYTYNPRISPDDQTPATQVTWIHAAKYCRWLSEEDKLPKAEMCFPAIEDIKEGMKLPPDYLRRTGYRLPTSAEWECVCRAGTVTSRSYGSADELLKYYGWYRHNAQNRTWPVGLLKPNDLGIFDMYGNVMEWCSDPVFFSKEVEERLLRGSTIFFQPEDVRTAPPSTMANRPTYRGNECGMRVARTLSYER